MSYNSFLTYYQLIKFRWNFKIVSMQWKCDFFQRVRIGEIWSDFRGF